MASVHGGNLHHPDTEAIKLSKAGALEPIFIIIFLNASSAQCTSQQL
jgi:hypothetical protein